MQHQVMKNSIIQGDFSLAPALSGDRAKRLVDSKIGEATLLAVNALVLESAKQSMYDQLPISLVCPRLWVTFDYSF